MINGKKGKLILNLLVLSLFFILSINNVSAEATCQNDNDCGINRFVGNSYCESGKILQNYLVNKCNINGVVNQELTTPNNFYHHFCGAPFGIVIVANRDFLLTTVEKPIGDNSKYIYLKDKYDNILQKSEFRESFANFDYTLKEGQSYKLILTDSNYQCQKYFFSLKGKKYYLFNITESISQGGGVIAITGKPLENNGSFCTSSKMIYEKTDTNCVVNKECTNWECRDENTLCKSDSDCGTDGYVHQPICVHNEVFQDYRKYNCKNKEENLVIQNIAEPDDFINNVDGNPYGIVFVPNKNFTLTQVEKYLGEYGETSLKVYLKDYRDDILQVNSFIGPYAKLDYKLEAGKTYKLVLSADYPHITKKYKTSFIGKNYDMLNITGDVYVGGGIKSISSYSVTKSICSYTISKQLKTICNSPQVCLDGSCVTMCISDLYCDDNNTNTEDKCINPGMENSHCENKEIICRNNKDCGTNQYVNDPFCIGNNLTKNYQIFECRNPGTGLSRCINYTVQKVNKTCNDECLNGKCVPECKQNSDCGIDRFIGNPFCNNGDSYKTFIEFTCENPGTIESKCSNQIRLNLIEDCTEKQTCISGKCMQITCNKNSECGKNSYVGNNYCVDENVTKNYQIFECRNPGTYLSKCINYTVPKVNKTCNESCENGQCVKGVIKCNYDNDCGRDGYIGGIICKDGNIFEDYIDYTCNNKGTFRSFCSFEKKPKITLCSQKQTCINGMCVEVICKINSDCGTDGFIGNTFIIEGKTYQKYQTFTCTDAGTIFSRCKSNIEDRQV